MAKRTYEGLLLEKKLADLITILPSQGRFHVTAEQRTQLNNSMWIPMLKQSFVSDAKKNKKAQRVPAVYLEDFQRQTNQTLAKDDPSSADYKQYLKMKAKEDKVKKGQAKLTQAMAVAKFVVGISDEPVVSQNLSPEVALKHFRNRLGAKHMLHLMPFMYGGTDTEADAAFWKSSINQINSILGGDYGDPQRQALVTQVGNGNP